MDGAGAIALDCKSRRDKTWKGNKAEIHVRHFRTAGALCASLVIMAGATLGEDWHALRGADIAQALERHVLRYEDGSEQVFNYGGLTEYRIGWPNEGRWRVRAEQYCALWPPSQTWACYKVSASVDGHQIQFIDGNGQATVAEVLQE